MSRSRDLWVGVAITASGAILRFAALGHQSFDHDEAVTALRVIQPDFGATMRAVTHTERSPPLYYLLAWLWSKAFGTGEVGLRSLSAIFGTLTIPAAYLATRELVSRRAGLIAAGFVALNPYLIWYSQEARSYALYALFSAWAIYFFARALRDRTRRSIALWTLASALALCSHYFAVFQIIPEGLWLFHSIRPRRRAIAGVVTAAIVGGVLAPLAVGQEAGQQNLFRASPLALRAGQALMDFAASVEPSPLTGAALVDAIQVLAGLGVAVVLGAAIAIVARRGVPLERRAMVVVGAVGIASFGLPLLLAAAGYDFVEPRKVLIGSVVPLLVVGAIGLGSRRAGRAGTAGAAAVAAIFIGVLGAVYLTPQMQRPNWRAAAEAIGSARQSRVLVVPSSGQVPLAYYLHATDFRPRKGPGRIRAREIDALGTRYQVDPPGRGFRLVGLERVAGSFWLRRYLAWAPRVIGAREVSGDRVLDEPSLVLANRVRARTDARRRPLRTTRAGARARRRSPAGRAGARTRGRSPAGRAARGLAARAGRGARGASPPRRAGGGLAPRTGAAGHRRPRPGRQPLLRSLDVALQRGA